MKNKIALYELALNLTNDSRQASTLVVAAFRQAFQKYSTLPCPEDCFPSLSASIYLMFASGDELNNPCLSKAKSNTSTDASDRTTRLETESAQTCRSKPPTTSTKQFPIEFESNPSTAESTRGYVNSQTCADSLVLDPFHSHDGTARYAQTKQENSFQPLNQQVFDPNHTKYWMPGIEATPPHTVVVTVSDPTSDLVGAVSDPAESSIFNAVVQEQEHRQQPNISQAYMYNAKVAKKRKSIPLFILNTVIFLLLIWILIGLLIQMEILPKWNLGYAWFNLFIYPLF